jgi:hypothetical protein
MSKSSKFRFALVPFALLLVVLVGWSTMASAAPQTVSWQGPANRSNSGDKSVYPSIAYDAQGFMHILWLEYDGGESQTSRLWYTNNINGSFRSPFQVVSNAGKNVEHITAIAVETNRVHAFYTSEGKSLRHTVVTLDGGNPSVGNSTTISQGRGYAPAATVDASGRVHAAWIDNRSGRYQVYHRIWNNGWDGTTRLVRETGNSQDSPSIVATNDGRVHMLFSIDGSTLGYSVFDGNWTRGNSPAAEYGNISGLATDGTTLFAVWSTKPHRIQYAEGRDGNWNNRTQISDGGTWSDYPSIGYSRGNNKVYAAWSAPESPNSKILVREIVPGGGLNDIVTIGNTAPSTWARAAGGPTSISVVWQDKSPGAEEIRHSFAVTAQPSTPTPIPPTATPTPPPPSGALELSDPSVAEGQDGTLYTNQATVNARIIQTGGGQANEYGLSDGSDPGDPGQGFNGSDQTVQFPLSVNTNDASCQTRQVNGRLQSSQWGTSELFGDSITYDPSVDADVYLRNPNLLYDVPPSLVGEARTAAAPVNFGDPNYTNISLFYLSLRNGETECSGLDSYSIDYTAVPGNVTEPEPATLPLTAPGGPGSSSLPGTVEGEYRFRIGINDNAGNTGTYPAGSGSYSIIYDKTNPVVRSSGTISLTEITDGYVTIATEGLTVTDNLYETDGRQYYGMWVAVQPVEAGAPSDVEWQARGVPVVGGIDDLRWNMAMGLLGISETNEYVMYVRFIDGAGNVSDEAVSSVAVEVEAFQGPRLYLPQVFTP